MTVNGWNHRLTVQNPGLVADGQGGWTEGLVNAVPSTIKASIESAGARDLARFVAGTVQSSATHILRTWYHPEITTQSVLTWEGQTFHVVGVTNDNMMARTIQVACVAVQP